MLPLVENRQSYKEKDLADIAKLINRLRENKMGQKGIEQLVIPKLRTHMKRVVLENRGFFIKNKSTIVEALMTLSKELPTLDDNSKKEKIMQIFETFFVNRLDFPKYRPTDHMLTELAQVLDEVANQIQDLGEPTQRDDSSPWNTQEAVDLADTILTAAAALKDQTVVDFEVPTTLSEYDDLMEAVRDSLILIGPLTVRLIAPNAQSARDLAEKLNRIRNKTVDARFKLTSRVLILAKTNNRIRLINPADLIASVNIRDPSYQMEGVDLFNIGTFSTGEKANYQDATVTAKFYGAVITKLSQKVVELLIKRDGITEVISPKALDLMAQILNLMAIRARETLQARAA